MNKRLLFLALLFVQVSVFAEDNSVELDIDSVRLSILFDKTQNINIADYTDFVAKENRIQTCISDYVEKQNKSYAKISQEDLYQFFENFNKVVDRVYTKTVDNGKKKVKKEVKQETDNVPYDEKLRTLGTIQCEEYEAMGVLK